MKNVIVKNIVASMLLSLFITGGMEAGLFGWPSWLAPQDSLGSEHHSLPGWVKPASQGAGVLLLVGRGYMWGSHGFAAQRRLVKEAAQEVKELTSSLGLAQDDLKGAHKELEDRAGMIIKFRESETSLESKNGELQRRIEDSEKENEGVLAEVVRNGDLHRGALEREALLQAELDDLRSASARLEEKIRLSEVALGELEAAVSPRDEGGSVNGFVEAADRAGEYYGATLQAKELLLQLAHQRERTQRNQLAALAGDNAHLRAFLQRVASVATGKNGAIVIPVSTFRAAMSDATYLERRHGLVHPKGPNGSLGTEDFASGRLLENGHKEERLKELEDEGGEH